MVGSSSMKDTEYKRQLEENSILLDIIENFVGILNTPVMKRKCKGEIFEEVISEAVAILEEKGRK